MLSVKVISIFASVLIAIVLVIFFMHPCPPGKMFDSILNQCVNGSGGWKITGYFTPLEADYTNDSLVTVYVKGTKTDGTFDYVENGVKYYLKQFRKTFIHEINIQGSGKTNDDKILQTWGRDYINYNGSKTRFYHYESCAKTSSGLCMPSSLSSLDENVVMVAVTNGPTNLEEGTLLRGTLLHIPDIPAPWNTKTFWAVDVGEWHDKHIDIYTGYGLKARAEAERITKLPPLESSRVLIAGYNATNALNKQK